MEQQRRRWGVHCSTVQTIFLPPGQTHLRVHSHFHVPAHSHPPRPYSHTHARTHTRARGTTDGIIDEAVHEAHAPLQGDDGVARKYSMNVWVNQEPIHRVNAAAYRTW